MQHRVGEERDAFHLHQRASVAKPSHLHTAGCGAPNAIVSALLRLLAQDRARCDAPGGAASRVQSVGTVGKAALRWRACEARFNGERSFAACLQRRT